MVTDRRKDQVKSRDLPTPAAWCMPRGFCIRPHRPLSFGFPMSAMDLVIFDCDGVLVDSEVIAARVEADLITSAGFEISPEEISLDYAGLTFKDILLRIEQKAQIPFQASLIDQAEALTDRRLAAEVRAIDGAREAVRSVEGPRCVCSNSRPERIELMLGKTGLLPLFEGRIFSSLATPSGKPKPAPDVFLHAAGRMNADPARTFVIEDSVHGIAGARAAGMRVIGFTGASHSYPGHADALTDAGAETVIRRWAELQPVLAALAEWSENA
jgi:HAD superfamily hydrolase (TIGR01509 family)